jgi:hypothetical protein
MLLAGIQEKSLDARLRGYNSWKMVTHLCGAALSRELTQKKLPMKFLKGSTRPSGILWLIGCMAP